MQLMKLGSFALVAALAASSVGCVVRAHGRVGVPVTVVEVEEEPPPPRYVTMAPRPGYIWITGRWTRRSNQWVWADGRYERQRANHSYNAGRWEKRGRRWVWVDGSWRAGARVRQDNRNDVRDHRKDKRRDERRETGPVIRDHRR